MRLTFLLALAAVLLAASPAPSQAPAADTTAVLFPGDAIKVTVWRKDELSGEFLLGQDGAIQHPLYRHIRAAGVPLSTVEAQILESLRRLEANPQFVVQPLFRISVVGDVRTPNLYPVPPGTTVAQAIAMAGGPTERGRLDRIRLLREGGERSLDLTRPGSTDGRIPIHSGDQILVTRRVNIFREYIAPASGLLATAVSLYGIILQQRNNR